MSRGRVVIGYNSAVHVWTARLRLIRAIEAAGFEVLVLAPGDGHAGRLAGAGIRHEVLPMRMDRNPVTDARLTWRFRRALKRIGPVAYLGFTAKPNIYGSLAAQSLGIPTVNNIAGLGATFGEDGAMARLMMALYRVALARARRVFFQNPDDAALFAERGVIRHGRTEVLPGSGVDLARFAPVPLPAEDGRPFRFLFIGRLLREKGVVDLVEAARLLGAGRGDLEVRLLGEAAVDNPGVVPAAHLQAWQAEGLVRHAGFTDDVAAEIAEAHCVVLPSYYREGTPRVLLEAAAMGRPVIAADSVGCREAVIDGETGLLCRARDPADLARAMARLRAMPRAGLEAMGLRGRAYMERRFDEAIVIARYLAVLEGLDRPG